MKFKTILFGIFLLASDRLSKYFFYNQNILSSSIFIHPSFNTGISRSLPIHLYIIILISIFAILALFLLLKRKKISQISFILLLAGTLGNLIDRVFLGGVRDFINIPILNFPIFNIADILLNIGIIILIIQEIRLEKKNDKTTK